MLRNPAIKAHDIEDSLLINVPHNSALELKENTTIVVLGASGDLAKKKTVRDGQA